jgi:hypothetical protein
LPAALSSQNPLRWMTIFGPGAIIASLTIGAGELIFSSRAGSLFGYNILWFFLLVLVCKWVLVFSVARHMVLTGEHSFQAWTKLPGPRGWLPIILFIFAVVCFPVWVCFHAGTLGTLIGWLTGTLGGLNGSAHYLWGIAILLPMMALSLSGGYALLEKAQLVLLFLMLASITIVLFLMNPDWLGVLAGTFIPHAFNYPEWVNKYPEVANRSPWLESITYVGVLGGSSYDYLAYVSYLREKRWGLAGIETGEKTRGNVDPRWIRAPLVDCTLSFVAVLLFTLVFVVCGHLLLGPQEKIPSGSNLLTLQSAFITPLFPGLRYLYFAGALLTILGTLYGTIEVAPTILREISLALEWNISAQRIRKISILWVSLAALVILGGSVLYGATHPGQSTPGLIALLTPANLFTGVLGCGIVCLLTPWMSGLKANARMPLWLIIANFITGTIFLGLGIYGYWEHSKWAALGMLALTAAAGMVAAVLLPKKFSTYADRR